MPLLAYVWGPVKEATIRRNDPGCCARVCWRQSSRAPWVPSTWMREILNEGGLLRGRILRRLPYEKCGS